MSKDKVRLIRADYSAAEFYKLYLASFVDFGDDYEKKRRS
jgi:hypothetical protein